MLAVVFAPDGWEAWGLQREPLIRPGMPVLIDEDLRFEVDGRTRPSVVANRWLRELPTRGAPAARTWAIYAGVLRQWLEFVRSRGIDPFGEELRLAVSAYAGHRLSGPLDARLRSSTWNLHVGVLADFYQWAVAEGYATAVPFAFRQARRLTEGGWVGYERNLAKLRVAKPHTTIKYLEPDFAAVFVNALAGLCPDGTADEAFRGRQVGRNAAMAALLLASGLRRREFTHLLVDEIPPLPARRTVVPIPLPVGHAVAKGGKQRTTWVSYDALAAVHEYIVFERAGSARGSSWRPAGEPLMVSRADWDGAVINGVRRPWRSLTAAERLRLVAESGGSCLLAVQADGAPFVDWATLFRRTSQRIRDRFEPRFPIVSPHRLRHSFAMHTLERLTRAYYQQAAALVRDTDDNAGLALYLTKADPWEILRDLLGHSSVLTTQIYVARIDTTRIYRQAYEEAGRVAGWFTGTVASTAEADVAAEVDSEFDEERD